MGKISKKKQLDEEANAAKEFEELLNNWNGFVRVPTEEILKKLKYKVSLEKLFKPDEFKSLSNLEKKRIKNINDRLSLMFVAGMPLPSENALRIKVGLIPRRKFVCNKDSDDDDDGDDETWKPNKPKPAQSLLSLSEYAKRQRFFLMNLMVRVDGAKIKISECKEEMMEIMGSWASDMLKAVSIDPKRSKKEKSVQVSKEQSEKVDSSQYATRGIKKDYTEPEVPENDHYLWYFEIHGQELPQILFAFCCRHILNCDDCDKLYEGECSIHGPYVKIPNTVVKLGLTDRARRSCPDGISVAKSKIRSGGLGVWADKDFSRNSVFGPYEGVDVHRLDVQKLRLLFEGGCAWEIYKKGKLSHYIDGSDVKKSNWLRYINCARSEDEQNLVAYQYKGEIYYRAYKEIKQGMELLVWYGGQYAEQLGIAKQKLVTTCHRFSFSESYHECKKCGQLFANEEAIKRHTKAKHPDRSVVKRYKCEFCSYSSDRKFFVDRHTRTHTKEKPFECSVCSKKFTEKGSLKRHIRIHTNERPYECSKCGKKFNVSSALKRHIRTVHDKCKSFVCKVCGFIGGHLCRYKTHMLTHTGVRNYKCQYCDKRFAVASSMRQHERIHTGEKPYKCKECSAAFTQSSNLRNHVVVHHTKRYPYRCPVCDKGFLKPDEMKKHESRCKVKEC